MKKVSNEELFHMTQNAGSVPGRVGKMSDAEIVSQSLFVDQVITGSPLADWVRLRGNEFGETVKPEQVYIVGKDNRPHFVAWLQRSGMSFESGETYSFFHIACDCALEADLREEPDLMFSCEALTHAVMRRAKELRALYKLPEILPSDSSENMGGPSKQIVISGMMYILERDRLHPEAWAANYLNGRHELGIWSVLFNREVEELAEYAVLLQEKGVVEVENESTVRLAEAA